jgi:hypothetical protein
VLRFASAARNDTFLERKTVFRNVSGARVPHPIFPFMFDAVLDGLAQRPQPERLANDETMQGQCKHQGVPLGLFEHFLELVDDHVSELAAGVVAVGERAGVV